MEGVINFINSIIFENKELKNYGTIQEPIFIFKDLYEMIGYNRKDYFVVKF